MPASEADKKRIQSEIEYRPLAPSDIPDIAKLIVGMREEGEETLRIRTYDPDYYEWMYFKNPAGRAIGYVARHKGTIIASFVLAPKHLQLDGRVVTIGKTMEIFTHPSYQGFGLMSGVANRVFDEARRCGIEMWYVTPSKNSYPIFLNKWNYVEALPVTYIVRILDNAAVLGAMIRPRLVGAIAGTLLNIAQAVLRRLPPPVPGFDIREERHFGPETDELWRRCAAYPVALIRDAAYLRWRYLDNPDTYRVEKAWSGDRLRGILVTKFTKRRGLKVGEFVDLIAPPEDTDVRSALYRHGLRRFAAEGCAFAQNWAIQDSAWEKEMMANGLNRRRKKMAILFSPNAPEKSFYDPKAWFLTPGDGNDL